MKLHHGVWGAALLALACGVREGLRQRARPTARVAAASIGVRLLARAEVVPLDGVAEVRARTEGRVLRVAVREGDRVRAGDLLAELDPASFEAEVQRREAEQRALAASASSLAAPARREEQSAADAEVAAARREAELAGARLARIEQLHRGGSAPEAELDAARAAVEVTAQRARATEARARALRLGGRPLDVQAARARAGAADAAVALARRDLDRARLVAPIDGVVLARRVDPGDVVTAATVGEALFELADPTRVEVRAEVEDLDAPGLAVGMGATLSPAQRSEVLGRGTVTRVGGRMERRRIGIEDVRARADTAVRVVWITPATPEGWVIGQRLDAFLALPPRAVETAVPRAAVRVTDGRAFVETPALGGLRTDERTVRLGAADATRVEVLGLAAGATVVLRRSDD
jgi:multidrug resistance efflux pump